MSAAVHLVLVRSEDLCALGHRVLGFRRHIVLVVLGQHLARLKHAVGTELALGHDALALLEQVGQHTLVLHRYLAPRVGHDETDCHAVGQALDRSFLHQASDTEALALGHLARRDIGRAEIEHQILLEGRQHQNRSHGQHPQTAPHQSQSLMSRFHPLPCQSDCAACAQGIAELSFFSPAPGPLRPP